MEQHKAWLNAICDGGYQVSTHEITVELWGMAEWRGMLVESGFFPVI